MNRPQEFVVVNQAAETPQLTFKKLEIDAKEKKTMFSAKCRGAILKYV